MRKKKIGSIVIGSMAVLLIAGGVFVQQNYSSVKNNGIIVSGAKENDNTNQSTDTKNMEETDKNSAEKNMTKVTGLKDTDTNRVVQGTVEDYMNLSEVETPNIDVPMVELPSHITGMKSEKEANDQLRNIIRDYYDIPEEFYETTSYYYNYVDLDNDGNKEILAVVIGPYTSGTGGSSALWLTENGGKWHVNQDFTLVNMPVIISDKVTNGYHELVVPYYGGGQESSYAILKCKDGEYSRVSDSETVKNLDEITGTAILTNDIPAERDAGIEALNLSEKK